MPHKKALELLKKGDISCFNKWVEKERRTWTA